VHPRTLFGLIGVVASPLLHADLYHLLSNTAGLLIFGTLVLLWSRKEFAAVTVASTLIGGLGVWLVGASGSIHIGASGVVFGYFGYVLMRGWYERKPLSIIISIVVAWMFGSLLASAIPGLAGPGISWEGHLFGMLGGVLVARRFKALRERIAG
jgi:membrane associated rhomboid family serine protease